MFCEVTPLRAAGLRLRPAEWPEPARGLLKMHHMSYADCAARRTTRRLDLLGEWVSHPICLLHLFEPEFVDVVGDGMLLRGHVIESRDSRTYEHEQLWLVRPRSSAEEPPLPRFDPSKWMKKLPVEERTGKEPSISEEWHKRHVRT
jgi:hypothetical protein